MGLVDTELENRGGPSTSLCLPEQEGERDIDSEGFSSASQNTGPRGKSKISYKTQWKCLI